MASALNSVPPVSKKMAVGYVRVSTSMQADDGLSLDAQRAAIEHYCSSHDLRLIKIYSDVESGGKADRAGLAEALKIRADVFVVLKFDRLSRSIKHFCQLYEDYFSSRTELVAIREAIKLDSALGRALVSILLVFAQMEREATGERTRESIAHIRKQGFHFGKVPYGSTAVPAPDNPRYRVLVENPAEQSVLAVIKGMVEVETGLIQIADHLNGERIAPPQGQVWTKSLVYNLKRRYGWHAAKPVNARTHTDEEVKARMLSLRNHGHTYQQVANILNEEGYQPYKGKKFSEVSIRKLLLRVLPKRVISAREFAEHYYRENDKPSLARIASALKDAGFLTPRGNTQWWPAQVTQLMVGKFDQYYRTPVTAPVVAQAAS